MQNTIKNFSLNAILGNIGQLCDFFCVCVWFFLRDQYMFSLHLQRRWADSRKWKFIFLLKTETVVGLLCSVWRTILNVTEKLDSFRKMI